MLLRDPDAFLKHMKNADLTRKAEANRGKSVKSGKTPEPVVIQGREIASTWWGKAWCLNLEKYADYQNRIGRGKSYVRAGAVIDLKVDGGQITARVQGSRATPYKVEVSISPMPEMRYRAALKSLGNRIENLEALVNGDFPLDMKSLITDPKIGLFPNPKEIRFACSCPDWASMCKHVAAVLYGIGSRLDQNPLLFFGMRGMDVGDFVQRSVEEKLRSMLKNADAKSPRVIQGKAVEDIFGIL